MNLKEQAKQLVDVVKQYKQLLVLVKGSPDPDAIAAAFAFKLTCEHLGVKVDIVSPVFPSLPQNAKMIKDLHLPIRFKKINNIIEDYDAYVVLDHQSVFVEGLTGVIPCAVHIDHHKKCEENFPVDCRIVLENKGSTSTIMLFIIKELDLEFEKSQWKRAATAIYYGIQTDTDNFRDATEADMKALDTVAHCANKALLKKINDLPLPRETMDFLNLALQNHVIYKDWLIAGIGYIDKKFRDNIAIIGDFLLRQEDINTAVVFTIVETDKGLTLDASFRTSDEKLNLNRLIKGLTREGGARKFKGAFQVNLDFFVNCPDKESLWQVTYDTTLESLKKMVDEATRNSIRHLFSNLKRKVTRLFK